MRSDKRLIECDAFPFEFVSRIGAWESWRKEIHRPVYHVHKWWAKRLGSVFRGILLGCLLEDEDDLERRFYAKNSFAGTSVFDPFMGCGTTVGEAHKLGLTAIGRDINPVAVESANVAFGRLDRDELLRAFERLADGVGRRILELYESKDSRGRTCNVLYYFWVMQVKCSGCGHPVDLFSSYVFARNARPERKPRVHVVCPGCGDVFAGRHGRRESVCGSCGTRFDMERGPARGAKAICRSCGTSFPIIVAVGKKRPTYRLFGKLVLTSAGEKEYLPASEEDRRRYSRSARTLRRQLRSGKIRLPDLSLVDGRNCRQAMGYGFKRWRDFFNDRQLLALGRLQAEIAGVRDEAARRALMLLFSGILEFNNLFTSYKGEGTGAVRHMFAHHILKPERTPIEANPWGTAKSSGSFLNLFRSRLLRAIDYRHAPVEVTGSSRRGVVASEPFAGEVETAWPPKPPFSHRGIYLSCGDSAQSGLSDKSVDLIVTDPPFFDNVYYSELADFFYAWQQIPLGTVNVSTRCPAEVQDSDSLCFERKLRSVMRECERILRDDGIFVFTFHHSRDEGWIALAKAVLGSGFRVVNAHPVRSEMSVAAPKSQAREPIQLDAIIVCRKVMGRGAPVSKGTALDAVRSTLGRLKRAGIQLSRNDAKVVAYGQMIRTLRTDADAATLVDGVAEALACLEEQRSLPTAPAVNQFSLF